MGVLFCFGFCVGDMALRGFNRLLVLQYSPGLYN